MLRVRGTIVRTQRVSLTFHPDTLAMTLEEIKVRSIATVAGGYAIILLLNVTATGKITLAGRR